MKELLAFGETPAAIFVFCLLYALHMVEEFTSGFVKWADRYFGRFNWTQNLIGNAGFFIILTLACYLYYSDPARYLWIGMSAAMWVLSNAFLHISATILSGEYSPGVVTATVLYLPGGAYFLIYWGGEGFLTWGNAILSFTVGGLIFMLIPTLARAVHNRARFAQLFHLIK